MMSRRSLLGVLLDRTRAWLAELVVCDAADGDPGAGELAYLSG